MPQRNLTTALDKATDLFVAEIIDLIRGATINDLIEAVAVEETPKPPAHEQSRGTAGTPSTAPGQEPVQEPAQPASVPTDDSTPSPAPEPPQKATRKRSWPTCSIQGCTSKMYPASGAMRLCYQHHLEAGGKPSPFSRRKVAAEGAQEAVEARQGVEVGLGRGPGAGDHPGGHERPWDRPRGIGCVSRQPGPRTGLCGC